jgi:hypothetical protein
MAGGNVFAEDGNVEPGSAATDAVNGEHREAKLIPIARGVKIGEKRTAGVKEAESSWNKFAEASLSAAACTSW